eukprot:NODE_322_length_1893_cov_215.796638_g231_i0.p1 GENE.NODE_322_length_1893_cov_215.796638_g231_i0~~NODE_322_length_1893_cov_215.796638_g231_i0.p1  ORF type:complete len:388 (-),score=79.04 NODE_322_length_1893_cov_215.796638_g231_i0:667-1830(-)
MDHSQSPILEIIDPLNRTGKVPIPSELVFETQGKAEYLKLLEGGAPRKRDFSLCMLFQRAKCHAGPKCHQIHAPRDFISHLREQAGNRTCCKFHGDARSAEGHYESKVAQCPHLTMLVRKVNRGVNSSSSDAVSIASDRLARTGALETLLGNSTGQVAFSATQVCRLHQEEKCRFGKDCKNIHVCRELWRTIGELGSLATTTKVPKVHTQKSPPNRVRKPVEIRSPENSWSFAPATPSTQSRGGQTSPSVFCIDGKSSPTMEGACTEQGHCVVTSPTNQFSLTPQRCPSPTGPLLSKQCMDLSPNGSWGHKATWATTFSPLKADPAIQSSGEMYDCTFDGLAEALHFFPTVDTVPNEAAVALDTFTSMWQHLGPNFHNQRSTLCIFD